MLGEADLPLKLAGISHCFRTEAGAHGRESRGLYRVHQFTKVEMFVFCRPEDSEAWHAELRRIEEQIWDALEMPYRVIDIAAGDLGAPAYRKFDLEAWMPGRGEGGDWGEITSTSNCTDYQARRLKIRFKREAGEKKRTSSCTRSTAPRSRTPARSSPCSRTISAPTAASRSPKRCAPTWAATRSGRADRARDRSDLAMTPPDAAPTRLVVGTAGHIDHGKTALIRALTGVDTDRLPEEQARGITIDLGFAPLDLPSGRRLGVVDVPGHEGLVRTMVAGATGIDLVLLVVAADEGVMPQTREHLAICHLLGVSRGVVALTRCDLVDDEMVELAGAEVEDLLAGTGLAGAPAVPVSSVTGQGLDALREALDQVAAHTGPRTSRRGPPRLWIDRAFSLRGFGSVVTGTLTGGALSVGDDVEIWPAGDRSRIRGLQSHGRDAERVEAGERCAINLQTVERDKLARGQLLSRPGALLATDTADVRIDWLASAPEHRDVTAVELLCGTRGRRARLAPIGGQPLRPGASSLARLHVDGPPIAVLPGERFIVRGFARHAETGHTLGGGVCSTSLRPIAGDATKHCSRI